MQRYNAIENRRIHWRRVFLISTRHIERIRGAVYDDALYWHLHYSLDIRAHVDLRPVYSDAAQLNSTRRHVELSCVAINGPLVRISRCNSAATKVIRSLSTAELRLQAIDKPLSASAYSSAHFSGLFVLVMGYFVAVVLGVREATSTATGP